MSKTVEKGLKLLELLARGGEPRGVVELARELEVPKSNVFRLLDTLSRCGFLRKRVDGRYDLTLLIWELGNLAFTQKRLVEITEPYLQRLVDLTDESAHLAVIDGNESVFIDKKDGTQPIRSFTELGSRAPASCCATGKAALAFQTEAHLERALSHLPRFTETTITAPKRLREEIAEILVTGYALNRGEWYPDVWGVAAPVLAADNTLCATIGIWAPKHRIVDRLESLGEIVRGVAEELSGTLGCTPRQRTSKKGRGK